jgi:hypothetical protein
MLPARIHTYLQLLLPLGVLDAYMRLSSYGLQTRRIVSICIGRPMWSPQTCSLRWSF